MSAISTYLEYIRSKIYAKDVRTAIVNAISQCYNDVNAPALQTEAMEAAVQAKIDAGEMAALTIGDGTITAAKFANGVIDNTLTQTGAAADAKAVGDAVGKCYEILVGNFETYANPHWEARYYSVLIPVKPGASLKITANSRHDALCACLKATNLPPEAGDAANFSETPGWTTFKTVTQGNTYSGTIPSDAEYLYVYLGADETMLFKPTSVIVEGVDYFGAVSGNIITLSQSLTESNTENAQKIDAAVSAVTNLYPFGIEPFQLSIFKRTQNLFSNFCYYRNKRYYRPRLSTSTVREPRITETTNYKGWLIRIKPNTTYTMGPLDYRLELLTLEFFLDKTISSVSSEDTNTITTGANSYWLCLTQRVGRDMSDWMLVEGDTYPAEYVSGKPQWVESLDDDEDDHSGITIAFMGDSITAGVATTKCYHQYIHDKYGFTCLNYGFGGSGFYRNSTSQNSGRVGQGVPGIAPATTPQNFFTPNNIVARLSELDADVVNLIVIFAGTNDWGNGVAVENYISGIESAFDYCLNNFPTIPVMVMTPIHRRGDTVQNSQGKTLREYVDILIEECKKYSIPYIDTMTDAGIYPDNDTNKETYFVTDTSGLHPSASGHKRIANAVWERIAGKVL